jgi:hypothetical protein
MKKHHWLFISFTLVMGFATATHYACQKEVPKTDSAFNPAVTMQEAANREEECFACPGTYGCLTMQIESSGHPYSFSVQVCGFEKDGDGCTGLPCTEPVIGGKTVNFLLFEEGGQIWVYKQPLCDGIYPKRFGLTNPFTTSINVSFQLALRNEKDELCNSSSPSYLIPSGETRTFIIGENPDGSCYVAMENCDTDG